MSRGTGRITLPSYVSTSTINNKYDTYNSGKGTGGTFTGSSISSDGYSSIAIHINADQNSTNNGVLLQASNDNTNFTTYFSDTYFNNTNYNKIINLSYSYYKLTVTFVDNSTNYTIITNKLSDNVNTQDTPIYSSSTTESQLDAFGKLRTTHPYTLLDIKFPVLNSTSSPTPAYLKNDLQLIYYNSLSGGSVTYGDSQANMTQDGEGQSISQSRQYCNYQPGKSLLIMMSFVFNTDTSDSDDYLLSVGYYDNYNGLFLQFDRKYSDPVSLVLRSSTLNNTTITDTNYTQSSWNMDKLDGTGNSGIILDFTKAQLLIIDLEWLSVGRVRFGFVCYGRIIYCHQITNVNSLSGPYMYTANLPVRYEIVNKSSGRANLTQICSTVISEGGYKPSTALFSLSTDLLDMTTNPNTERNVVILTGNNNYYHNSINIDSLNVIITTGDNIRFRIRLYQPGDTPLSGSGSFTDLNDHSVTKYDTSDSPNVAGSSIIINEGFIQSKSSISTETKENIIPINQSITSNILNDEIGFLVVTLQNLSNSSSYKYAVSVNISER
jgi:hypothetical protein